MRKNKTQNKTPKIGPDTIITPENRSQIIRQILDEIEPQIAEAVKGS
jgi:hypothetical protein